VQKLRNGRRFRHELPHPGHDVVPPTGMKIPNSRSRPRTVSSREVRVASHVDRRQCSDAIACCGTLLTGTA
jgi:hypothetical protein